MPTPSLILDEQTRKAICAIVAFAENNFFDLTDMQKRRDNPDAFEAPEDIQGFSCYVPVGFKCVYTVECHPRGWCKHMSVRIGEKGKLPKMEHLMVIISEFFPEVKKPEDLNMMWTEDLAGGYCSVHAVMWVKPVPKVQFLIDSDIES